MSQSPVRSPATSRYARWSAALLALALLTAIPRGEALAAARSRPPALATSKVRPTPGSVGVRPDAGLQFDLGPQLSGPGGPAVRRRLAARAFSVLVVNETGARMLVAGGDPAVAVDDAGLVTVRWPQPLPRYTWHTAALRLLPDETADEDAWARLIGGQWAERPGVGSPWLLKTIFRTGSDLHEPTRIELTQAPAEATAGGEAVYRLTVLDDYGLPAWDVRFSALAEESGPRLPGSAVLAPKPTAPGLVGPDDEGQVVVRCADPEAEAVRINIRLRHPKYDFAAEQRWDVRFRPGAPRDLALSAPDPKAVTGDPLVVRGRVTDQFGNGVPAQAVSAEAWGSASASWRAINQLIRSDDDGSFSFSLTSPSPQHVQVRANVAAGAAAALDRTLLFEPKADPSAGVNTSRTLTRALAGDLSDRPGRPDLPLRVAPPSTVTATPGAFAPGAAIVVSLVENLGSWDPWASPLPATATSRVIGRGSAAADGSLALNTGDTFAPGDLVSIEAMPPDSAPLPPPPPPSPAPQPLLQLTGAGANGRAYVAQVLPPGSYTVRLQEDSSSGPESFAVFYYRYIKHNGWTEGVLVSLIETGKVSDINGSTGTFTLSESQTVSFMVETGSPAFNYAVDILAAP
ncbi:MAG: hypothetical protein ACYC6V_06535 [Bacillota bacterium]